MDRETSDGMTDDGREEEEEEAKNESTFFLSLWNRISCTCVSL